MNVEQGARFSTGDVSDDDVAVVVGDGLLVVVVVAALGSGIVISDVIVDVKIPPPPPTPGSGLVVATPSLFSSAPVGSEIPALGAVAVAARVGDVVLVLVLVVVVVVGEGLTGKAAVAETSSTYTLV